MIRMFKLTGLVLLLSLFAAGSLHAQGGNGEYGAPTNGFFLGGGGAFGYEVNHLQKATGGPTVKFGYQFNEIMSLYIQSDAYYAKKNSVTFWTVPIMPVLSYGFYQGVYTYIGVGYVLMRTSADVNFDGINITSNKSYGGFSTESGIGYNFWFGRVTLSPEIGFNYSLVASDNFFIPHIRATMCYHF